MSLAHELRDGAQPLWGETVRHPFLVRLQRDELAPAAFGFFLAQDALYLRDFARALALASVHARTAADQSLFLRHAAVALDVERELHHRLAAELGAALGAARPTPTTAGYTDHLLRIAFEGHLPTIVAAVLPCYWIYREVGEALIGEPPRNPLGRTWVETYAGEAYGAAVAEMIVLMDRLAEDVPRAERERLHSAFRRSVSFEHAFWDQALAAAK